MTTPNKTKPLITFPATLIIGTGVATTAYTVYFQHGVTQRIEQANVTSDGDGLISVDFTEEALGTMQEFFRPGVNYQAWVVLAGAGILGVESIIIDDTPVEMLSLEFVEAVAVEEQTIELI